MVLLTAVVIAVAIGLVQLFGSDDDDSSTEAQQTSATSAPHHSSAQPAPQASPAPAAPPAEESPAAQPSEQPAPEQSQAPAATDAPVHVFNNSTVPGLAGRTGDTLRGAGFDVKDVANLPSTQGVVPQSAVYYGTGAGEKETAEAVAQKLGVQAQPRPSGLAQTTPGVIVIVTQDQQH